MKNYTDKIIKDMKEELRTAQKQNEVKLLNLLSFIGKCTKI